jgi:phospholipid/cholesterol/gamma-HCH transport system substrate-binding protein
MTKVSNGASKIIVILLLIFGAGIILAYYYVTAGGRLPLSGHLYTITAEIQDPQALLKHADVRAAGVKVGSVSDITNRTVGQTTIADVQMQLNSDVAPVYRDATVMIRQKTLVGENYVEITRGQPQAGQLPDGGTLGLSQDVESVPLDKILNALTPAVRSQLRTDLVSLGTGLHHEGRHLNEFLGALQPTVYNGGIVFKVLADQRAQVADVVAQTGTVMQALANRTQDLRTLVTAAEQTAQAVASRDAALQQSLIQLPPTLAQARTSVATLAGFAGLASPVIANLRVAVTNLGPVMRELRPTAAAARRLFDDLPPFLRVANPLLGSLRRFSSAAKPAVPSIEALLSQANPALAYISPYYKEIGSFLMNFGNGVQKDSAGNYIGRCLCPVSIQSYSGFTPTEQALVQALIKAGGLGGIANPTANPYRAPGSLPAANQPFTGTYPQITADPPPSLRHARHR